MEDDSKEEKSGRRGHTGAGETPLCQPHNLCSDNTTKYTIILIKLYYDFQFLEFVLGNHK